MLSEFIVHNGYMTSEFNPEVFYYEIELDEGESFLDFDYEALGSVSVYGNDNLTYGDNHIIVEVYDTEVVSYTFLVHKEKSLQVMEVPTQIEDISIQSSIINDIKAPGIAAISFFIIVVMFCIIFRRK